MTTSVVASVYAVTWTTVADAQKTMLTTAATTTGAAMLSSIFTSDENASSAHTGTGMRRRTSAQSNATSTRDRRLRRMGSISAIGVFTIGATPRCVRNDGFFRQVCAFHAERTPFSCDIPVGFSDGPTKMSGRSPMSTIRRAGLGMRILFVVCSFRL